MNDISIERAEFSMWLDSHRAHFTNYDAWEVARLAIACGFTMKAIAPDLTDWLVRSRRMAKLWDNPLFEQWVEIWGYERGRLWDM